MIRKTVFVLANLIVISLAAVYLYDAWNVNRFAGVGGREEFRRQKLEQLDRMESRLDHLAEDVRERELAAIAEQRRELDSGLPAVEFGDELRRVK